MRLIASCLCLLCSLSALGAENLMRNPGFEEETRDGGAPEAWGIGKGGQFPGKLTWVADAARAHSGSAFVELASFDDQRSVTLYSGEHQRRFNEPLRFSLWCRGSGEVRLGVAAYYTTLKQGVIQWGEWTKAAPDWQKLAFDFQAQNPADVKGERLTPMHFAPLLLVKGKVALDDAALASPSAETAPAVYDPAAPTPLMTIPFTSQPPTIDGKLDDPAWRRAAAVTGFVQLDGQLSPRQTAVFATHDSERLYLAYRASFADVLREGRREHDLDFNHETDYCEFLVQPPGQGVFHAVFSPAGGILDLSSEQGKAWQGAWRVAHHVATGQFLVGGVWQMELSVAFADLGAKSPAEAEVWRMNFCRDFPVPKGKQRGLSDWTCWSQAKGSFANAQGFGHVRFSRSLPAVQLTSLGDPAGGVIAVEGNVTAAPKQAVDAQLLVTSADGSRQMIDLREAISAEKPFALRQQLKVSGSTPAKLALAARDRETKQPVFQMSVPFTAAGAFRLKLVRALSRGYADAHADLAGLPDLPEGFASNLELLPAGGTQPLLSQKLAGIRSQTRLDIAKLPPGDYLVRCVVAARDGKALATTSEPLTIPAKPSWLGNTIGQSEQTPPPWHPVKVEGRRVEVTQRVYELGDLGLPRAMGALGEPFLTRPVTLRAVVGGHQAEWQAQPIELARRTDRAVTWRVAAQAAGLQLSGSLRIEFDGFAYWDVEMTGANVDELALEIPLRAERALYARAYNALEDKRCVANLDLPGQSEVKQVSLYQYSRGGWAWPETFFHEVWVGDNERGLSLMCETDEQMRGKQRVTMERRGSEVIWRYRLVSEPTRLTSPLRYQIAYQATPVKPLTTDPKRWRAVYLGGSSDPELLKRIYVGQYYHGLKHICYPELFNERLTTPRVKAAHDAGAKIVPDFYFGGAATENPEFKLFGDEWEQIPRGGWSSVHGPAVYACERSTYTDFLLHSVKILVEKVGFDGIYTDVSAPEACSNETHGCGYVRDGERRPTVNLFALRELHKRIYTFLKSDGRDGCLFSHGIRGACLAGFYDVVTQGEEWGVERERQYTQLTPDLFRAKEGRVQYGVPFTWYTFHYYAWRARAYGTPATLNEILALCLPHRVLPTIHDAPIFPVWEFLNDWWTTSEFIGYWREDAPAKTNAPNILVSAYVKRSEKRALLVIANWDYEPASVDVKLNLDRLGLTRQNVRVVEALTNKPLELQDTRLPVRLDRRDHLMAVVSGM